MSNTISLVLSGGSSNINPNSSLGGDPSATPVQNNKINNLFGDISKEGSASGGEEYRCIYIFNDTVYALNNIKVWVYYDFPGSITTELGVVGQNEIQRISIFGPVKGGSFTVSYLDATIISNYRTNRDIWGSELQESLRNILDANSRPMFPGATVNVSTTARTTVFDIEFAGENGNRGYDLLSIESSLTPNETVNASILRTNTGSPINTIASEISAATIAPGGVVFFIPDEELPIELPKLHIGEGFPLWIKRVIPTNTEPKENDGFTMRITAEAVEN